MRTRLLSALFLSLALLVPGVGHAEAGLDLRLQQGVGGEELASVDYSDGSSYSLTLGTYTGLSVGGWWTAVESGPHALVLEGTLGFASWSTGPENTDDRMVLGRVPLEALAFYRLAPEEWPVSLRLGGGVAWHMVGDAHGTGALEGNEIAVGNALGLVTEADVIWEALVFSLRYTSISHEVGFQNPVLMSGSGLAFAVGLLFPIL